MDENPYKSPLEAPPQPGSPFAPPPRWVSIALCCFFGLCALVVVSATTVLAVHTGYKGYLVVGLVYLVFSVWAIARTARKARRSLS